MLKRGIFGQNHFIVDCKIDNESEARTASFQGVPQDVYLAETARGIIHKAEVAWRMMAGVGPEARLPTAPREVLFRRIEFAQ